MRSHVPLALLLATLGLAACGDDDAPAVPDGASPPPDGARLSCEGQPCLLAIEDEADWALVAADSTGTRCEIAQETKFLTPATAAAALQQTVYQDVKIHTYHLDFMRSVLAPWFGGLPLETYAALVQRRATREYWAGSIARIVVDGTLMGYGFDVIVDPTSGPEQLTAAEIIAVHDALAATFALPLGYAPLDRAAIQNAGGFPMGTFEFPVYLPVTCQGDACADDPSAVCVHIPDPAQVCGVFREGRTIEQEYAHLVRLDAIPGDYVLPKVSPTPSPITFFLTGEYGPDRAALSTLGHGRLAVTPQGDWIDYHYTQGLLGGGTTVLVDWTFSVAATGGQVSFDEPSLSTSVYINGSINASMEPDDMLQLASCTYEGLPSWLAQGAGANGSSFQLRYRHQTPMAGSGPLNLVWAQVTLGGTTVTVDDYFRLVYAGEHHNWNNQFWVLFDTPLTYQGHPVYGLWVDEADYSCCPAEVYTMAADLTKLDDLGVGASYTVTPE